MTELLRALHDHSLSAEERLKVACFVWKQEDVLLRGKEDVLTKWVCREINAAYSKKTRVPPSTSVCCKLWEFLSTTLHASLQKQTNFQPSINTYMIQCMNQVFTDASAATEEDRGNEGCAEYAVKSLLYIMMLAPLPPILYKYDSMVSLLLSVTGLALSGLRAGNPVRDVFSLLASLLKHYAYLQGMRGNQKKVFTTTCNRLLQPTLVCKNLLPSALLPEELKSRIIKHLDAMIVSLFVRDHLVDFTSVTSYVRLLFESLEKLLDPSTSSEENQQAALGGIPLLFGCFLTQNSKEKKLQKTMEFQFFWRLVQLLGYNLPTRNEPAAADEAMEVTATNEVEQSSVDWHSILEPLLKKQNDGEGDGTGAQNFCSFQSRLRTLCSCLNVLSKHDVYQVAEDRESGGKQFSQLQRLCVEILNGISIRNLGGVFSCLVAMMKLNHKTVEPLLPGILFVVFAVGYQTEEVDIFVLESMQLYSKLRQLLVFLESIVVALEMMAKSSLLLDANVFPPLSSSVENQLGRHVRELPPGQCMEIVELFCEKFEGAFLPRLKACDETPRKRKRRKFSHDAATLKDGSPQSIVAATQRFVDIFAAVISHIPLDPWGGRYKGRALKVMQRLQRDICQPFLELAPAFAADVQPSVCSASLHLACKCSELQACLQAVFPGLMQSDWMLKLAWQPSLSKPLIQEWDKLVEQPLGPQCDYLMRELAILHLRFVREEGTLSPSDLLGFVFEAVDCITANATWSGQLLDISEANSHVANWSLALTQLSLLYEFCSSAHLRQVADFILEALLLSSELKEGGEITGKLTLWSVAATLLESEAFQQMKQLHKLLLSTCFSHTASSMPKHFSAVLTETLVECTEVEGKIETEAAHATLSSMLHHGLEGLGRKTASPMKKRRKIEKWLKQLPVYLKLVRALPLGAVHFTVLLRCLLGVVTWHTAVAQLMFSQTDTSLPVDGSLMADLQYIISWILHAEANHQKESKLLKKKTLAFLGIPLELLLQWIYSMTKYGIGRDRLSNEDLSFLASGLTTIEMAMLIAVQFGEPPMEFIQKVMSELTALVKRGVCDYQTFLMEQCVKTSANLTSKVFSELAPGQRHFESLKTVLDQLLEMTLTLLELICQGTTANPYVYPGVVSAMVAIVRCRPELISPRVMYVAALLCKEEGLECTDIIGRTFAVLLSVEKLFAILDVLSLPSTVGGGSTEAELPPELKMLTSLGKVQQILCCIVEEVGCKWFDLVSAKDPRRQPSTTVCNYRQQYSFVDAVYSKLFSTMTQLLTASKAEEFGSILEHMSHPNFQSLVSIQVFYCCWNAVLSCKFSQEGKKELKKWLSKVLLKCESIVTLHQANPPIIALAIQLVTRLTAIPSQVGLDSRSVMVSLHLCSCLESGHSYSAESLIQLCESVTQLVSTVVRVHTPVATACPAPIFSTVNKLVQTVVSQGQALERYLQSSSSENGSDSDCSSSCIDQLLTHCAGMVSRLMESLSNHRNFVKFVPYTIGEFVATSQAQPLHIAVKKAILPGVFNLLKLCSDQDSAFIQASLSPSSRESFQILLAEYKKFHKFSGRV